MKMKTIELYGERKNSPRLLHVECPNCIVNIRVGLSNKDSNEVTSIEIIPDDDADKQTKLEGYKNNIVMTL